SPGRVTLALLPKSGTGVSAAPERAPPASARLREVSPPMPEPYTGEIDRCRGFLLQCSLVFSSSPQSFQTDGAKISFVVGNLRGRALKWAEPATSYGNGGGWLKDYIPFHATLFITHCQPVLSDFCLCGLRL
uniref:DUF4939 domain-containing protein n=1 Tax=Xiphophorus maculatus TaxID=8083 RepID=A0A3B5QZV0_XIPMA